MHSIRQAANLAWRIFLPVNFWFSGILVFWFSGSDILNVRMSGRKEKKEKKKEKKQLNLGETVRVKRVKRIKVAVLPFSMA